MNPKAIIVVIGSLWAFGSQAGVVFFGNSGSFTTARGTTVFQATEDFESSSLADNDVQFIDDPLEPGVANGPFGSGTNPATGLTVQSNASGNTPDNPNPHGTDGMVTASAGIAGTPSDQVGNRLANHSFDMIFGLAQTRAVSFNPLVFDATSSGDAGTATIRVYSTSNVLLGTLVDAAVAGFTNPTTFIGVVATGGDEIGRINIVATSTGDEFTGADNISVYTGPVPVELQQFSID